MLGGNIKNYKLEKVKNIFIDGEVNSINIFLGNQLLAVAQIKNNKVTIYEKTCAGGSIVLGCEEYKRYLSEYFNNNNNYSKVQSYIK